MAVYPGSLILGVCIEERKQYRRQGHVRRLDEHFSPPSDERREAVAKDQSGSGPPARPERASRIMRSNMPAKAQAFWSGVETGTHCRRCCSLTSFFSSSMTLSEILLSTLTIRDASRPRVHAYKSATYNTNAASPSERTER